MLNFFHLFNSMLFGSGFSGYMGWFHNFTCSFSFGVLVFVLLLLLYLIFNIDYFKNNSSEYQVGEFLCSMIPTAVLVTQMAPSLGLLYYYGLMNLDSSLTIKIAGHQWYWSYDYGCVENLEFDSYMKSSDQLVLGDLRLLDVDSRCVVPSDINTRFCTTSSDVIHSWAVPAFSVKLDGMSGIITTFCYNFPVLGLFYGQCSEICGVNHSFMPIVVECSLIEDFSEWVSSFM
uniref:Cytochrome c oxidase subunit 2 n=1 Tax=Rhigonema thysanophora TaxID=435730 RepID=X2CU35_9BILA|nr:cytochrome c oxidase subunit II [Rhigonema thysanophora]AGZ90404.1 cytochrome c oxidase subunit II [Rhigonema thysanophora]